MIHHRFYKEDMRWIGDAVAEGVKHIHGNFPLYAGLFLPDSKTDEELRQSTQYAVQNGAACVSFFGNVDDHVMNILKTIAP